VGIVSYQLKAFLSGLLSSLADLRKFGHDGGHRVSYACGQITAAERLGVLTYEQAKRFRDLLLSAGKHASDPFPCDENSGPCMPIDVWWSRHKTALEAKARLASQPVQTAEFGAVEVESKPKEGWGSPALARKAHYFVDGQSICNRWIYTGALYERPLHRAGNCSSCVRLLAVKPHAQDSANEKPEPVPAPAAPRELRLLCVLDILSSIDSPRYIPAGTMHRLSPRASVQGRWSLEGDAFYQLRSAHPKRPTAKVLVRCERHRQANAVCSIARII
jgi:hypothetical protein